MVTNMYIYTIYILNIIYYIYIIMKSHIFHAMKSHETPNDGQFFFIKIEAPTQLLAAPPA